MKQILIFLALFLIINLVHAKEIAITFDDSPRTAQGYFDGQTRAIKLIKALKDHQVEQVAFFSVSKNLNNEGLKRLQRYADAGHIIANHTHSHPNINSMTLNDYSQNILQADSQLSQFSTFKNLFRFPYLREGNTQEKRDGIRELLAKSGYQNAYITMNNYDWFMETLFQKEIKKSGSVDLTKMRDFYVQVLIESIEFYDQLAIKQLGRSPKHVLLLHEMDISALFIGDLVDELRMRGWKIITPEQAYTDEIAQYKTPNLFSFNPGRIGEIAKDNGQKKGLWHFSCDEEYLTKRFNKEVL